MWYSSITTLAIWDYNEKEVVFADISNPNTSISKIIVLKNPLTNEQNSHFQVAKMPKIYVVKHKETSR